MNTPDFYPDSLNNQRVSDAGVDTLVEGFHGLIVASNVEVLANDNHIDGVSKVGMEDVGDVAVGEHFFDLECIEVGDSHDGSCSV